VSEIEGQKYELRRALNRADKWLTAGRSLGLSPELDQRERLDEDLRTIHQLRTRASSSLITVALLGSFSSGKSFLIGGLQERLDYAQVSDDYGVTSDQYIGLLHSAAKATTACPASVEPVQDADEVDASRKGFYRVRFTDADAKDWVDLGNSPAPYVVEAYTTQDARAIARGRPSAHHRRTVAQLEISLADPALPAKLYDLPGHGSLHPIHDEIANNAWAEADCFIFSTQATHGLTMTDDVIINRLYQHHLSSSGKRVIWVLTGIDRAATANYDGKPEWEDLLEETNQYMRDNFPPGADGIDSFFPVEGFIPVSAAWEALGRWHQSRGDELQAKKLIAASRMGRLRRTLIDMIDSGTGREHLARVAVEAHSIIAPRQQVLTELLDSARLPLEQLSSEREDLSRRLNQLTKAIAVVRDQLEGTLRYHVKRTGQTFDGLAGYLHEELDEPIRAANLAKEKEASRLENEKTRVLEGWVAKGPAEFWSAEFTSYTENVLNTVRSLLRDTEPAQDLGTISARVDLKELTVQPSARYRTGTQDMIQKISGFVSISTPVAAAIAASAGVIAGPFLAVPAGVTLLAGVVYAGIRNRRSRTTALDLLREEWVSGLDDTAKNYREAFVVAAAARGHEVIDRAIELLSDRRDELSRKIILVESRLGEPENTDKGALVARLDPHCRIGAELLTALRAVSR
jgi:hypothetical protein